MGGPKGLVIKPSVEVDGEAMRFNPLHIFPKRRQVILQFLGHQVWINDGRKLVLPRLQDGIEWPRIKGHFSVWQLYPAVITIMGAHNGERMSYVRGSNVSLEQ